jgi:hypothetical protein
MVCSLFTYMYIYILNVVLLKVLYDMSQLLGTQLDKETLATCIGMIESGVNPEALAVSVSFFTLRPWVKPIHVRL